VYCESHVIDYKSEGKEKIYSYNYFDEDLRFFITKSDIFQTKKVIQRDSTYYEFNFLPKDKRLLAVKNKKPQYITDLSQMDSLYNVIVNRSVQAVQWYNENLWRQRIDTLPFIETGILGLAVNVRSFIIFDRSLMNMEVLDNYAFSHEIGHFWIGYNIQYSSKGFYFLSESLNEYTNLLFYENWAGKAEFENAINNKINMQYSDKEFFTTTFEQVLNQRNGDLKFELIYNKGVVFAHELRKMIGKENFLQIIRDTYHKPDNYITLTDFENSIKKNGCWNEYMKLYKMRL
jgi:aminopeptidase N